MTGVAFPSLNGDSLEQSPNLFYARLNSRELEKAREIVESLKEFMVGQAGDNYLVAGVGGILRYLDPRTAQDIDLAVSGFKYTAGGRHEFDHVIKFTSSISNYFEKLSLKLASEFGLNSDEIGFGLGSGKMYKRGSGPFSRMDRRYELNKEGRQSAVLESELQQFRAYRKIR